MDKSNQECYEYQTVLLFAVAFTVHVMMRCWEMVCTV